MHSADASPSLSARLDCVAPLELEALSPALFELAPGLVEAPCHSQAWPYHEEGALSVHLARTLDALSSTASAFEGEQRLVLLLAGLLHDLGELLDAQHAGKPSRDEARRLGVPLHARRARSYLGPRLAPLKLTPAGRRQLLSLIAHHHELERLSRWTGGRETERRGGYWRLSRLVDRAPLLSLSEADIRGRESPCRGGLLDRLRESAGAWDKALEGLSPHHEDWEGQLSEALRDLSPLSQRFVRARGTKLAESGQVSSPRELLAATRACHTSFPVLKILSGPSGSGKSTWVAAQASRARVISLDAIRGEICGEETDQSQNPRVVEIAKRRLAAALANQEEVVWDATSLLQPHRAALLKIASRHNTFTQILLFPRSPARCLAGNRSRERQVPDSVILSQFARWDWPDADEADERLIIEES